MADALAEFSAELPSNPDAQATVTDFLDYTEFYPSDLSRSLTLIHKLDELYHQYTDRIHHLTKQYGALPVLPIAERPDPETLRKDVSIALDHALRSREAAAAEASRLYHVTNSLCNRLASITKKLHALPKPPSRDPTPVPQPRSPVLSRTRRPEERTPRIKLVMDRNRHGFDEAARIKYRPSRRIIVPGDVLPPYDPMSPGASVFSDSASERAPSPVQQRVQPGKSVQDRIHKLPQPEKVKLPKPPRVRPAGVFGTNVHSAVAGISVSNALLLCEAPPLDAKIGSRHAPWLSLTEYEKNVLRKRMKKNAGWQPSDTMVRRELLERGRGRENMINAKARAEANAEDFLDEPCEKTVKLSPGLTLDLAASDETHNRGMSLNEAKKRKRQKELAETAQGGMQATGLAARDEIEEASISITDAGNKVMKLLAKQPQGLVSGIPMTSASTEHKEGFDKNGKKRKRDASPEAQLYDSPALPGVPEVRVKPSTKKLKLVPPLTEPIGIHLTMNTTNVTPVHFAAPQAVMVTTTTRIPLAPPGQVPTASTKISINSRPSTPIDGTFGASTFTAVSPRKSLSPSKPLSPSKFASQSRHATPTEHRSLVENQLPISPRRITRGSASTGLSNHPDKEVSDLSEKATRSTSSSISPPVVAGQGVPTSWPHTRGATDASLIITNKKAASAEPAMPRLSLRRASNASVPPSQSKLAVTRRDRGKRAPPGVLTSHEGNSGIKISLGVHKNKPAGKKTTSGTRGAKGTDTVVAEEEVYCYCREGSWGQMIACDNDECEREWFHLSCLGMERAPPSKSKWFCPDCRVALGVSEFGDKLPAEPPRRGRSGGQM